MNDNTFFSSKSIENEIAIPNSNFDNAAIKNIVRFILQYSKNSQNFDLNSILLGYSRKKGIHEFELKLSIQSGLEFVNNFVDKLEFSFDECKIVNDNFEISFKNDNLNKLVEYKFIEFSYESGLAILLLRFASLNNN